MTTVNLGIVDFKFNVNFPTIDCEIDLEVPKHIPKVGGKKFKLKKFSLSLDNLSVTVPVDLELFGGSITVGLNASRCEIEVGGTVTLNVIVKKYHWKIGPAHISYFNPLRLLEPSWSAHPVILDAKKLQSSIAAAPPSRAGSNHGARLHNDAATKAVLKALFTFCGAATLVDDMIRGASAVAANHSSPAVKAKGKHTALAAASSASSASSGGVVIGLGIGAGGGLGIGGSGGGGFFFDSGGDFGYYGSVAAGVGAIIELSAGATGFVYWPDAGQSALDCFKGYNWFMTLDGGEGLSGSLTLSWPCDNNDQIISQTPCGVALGLGVGGGYPVNFLIGNSHTWVDMNSPAYSPGPPHGH